MVDASLTYLDSLNRYIVLCYYKALTGLSEKSLVSTEPIRSYDSLQDNKHGFIKHLNEKHLNEKHYTIHINES